MSSINIGEPAPLPMSGKERYARSDKRKETNKRYVSGERGRAANQRYEQSPNRRARHRADAGDKYMARRFVAWDGEGLTEPDGSHTYFMLSNSLGNDLYAREGLNTIDVFRMMMSHAGDGNIHVGYGLGYDINMFLGDIPRDTLEVLYKGGKARWRGYAMEWRAGKSFALAKDGAYFRLFDVLPFFQRSFVSALDEYFGTDWEYREEIIAGKAARGSFQETEIESIHDYNQAELTLLVRLVTTLRERLYQVDIRISRWDGPGAIATALYKKHNVKQAISAAPPMVATAARNAYAGGRFEIIRQGHCTNPAYQYDIRSAYPHAIRKLPCLAHGEWTHVLRPATVAGFGLYRIEVTERINPYTQPQPLWRREKDGRIYYANQPHNWYWSPEADLVATNPNVVFHEAWEYETACDCEPFSFVEKLYNKRAALKKAGDGAHIGLKLGLNSLYG